MPVVVVTDIDEQPQVVAKKRKQPAASTEPAGVKQKGAVSKKKVAKAAVGDAQAFVEAPERIKQKKVKKAAPIEPSETTKAQPKQKKQKKGSAGEDDDGEAVDVSKLDAQSQARFLWEAYTNLFGGSFLEQEAFEAKNILALSEGPSLEARLQAAVPGWKRKFAEEKEKDPLGAPRMLIVASSALRALELMRQLPTINRGCKVAKLFSKHMKQEEQAAELQSRVVCVGTGTPNRLTRLAETEALSLDRLELVVLDLHRDVKKRSILDIPETRADWWELFKGHLSERVSSGKTRLCLYS